MPKRKQKLHHHVHRAWKKWPYKHTTSLVILIAIFILLLDSAVMVAFFQYISDLRYIGALIAGVLFASVFTVAPAIVMFYELGTELNIWLIALFGAVGSVLSDYLILRVFEDSLADEMKHMLKKAGAGHILRLMRRKLMRPFLAVLGVVIIASPLPDELGLATLDVSKLSKPKILMICFVANYLGILVVAAAGAASLTIS